MKTPVLPGDTSRREFIMKTALFSSATAVAGGGAHSIALKAGGTMVCWGNAVNGQCGVPTALSNAVAISAGENHTLVLLAGSLPSPQLLRPALNGKQFTVIVQTLYRKNYALESKNSLLASNWTSISTNSGNGALRMLTDPAATGIQRLYRMRQW